MRKLIYSTTVSLDGYITGPDGGIDWSVPDEDLFRFHTEQLREIGVHLRGRRLYETNGVLGDRAFEGSPLAADYIEFAQIWKALPKVVFSTTLEDVVGNTRLARDGVGEQVSRLKEQPGKDIAVGGAGLAGAGMKLGLIDEWRLFLSPVLLGGGTPYFPTLEQRAKCLCVEARPHGAARAGRDRWASRRLAHGLWLVFRGVAGLTLLECDERRSAS
jgi:dihydrofolate reductase